MHDELFEMANGLTYRVLLAFFPFVLFLLSLLGFLTPDESVMLDNLYGMLPEDIYAMVTRYIAEVYPARSGSLLSASFLFTVYAVSNGFRAAIHCINRAYNSEDKRGIVKKICVSIVLMFIFTLALLVLLALSILGGYLWDLLRPLLQDELETLYLLAGSAVSLLILLLVTMLIYKLACAYPLKLKEVLPGAGVTVLLWVAASKGFGLFIANFTNYSLLYGSIAGVFVLILWLDIISFILLLGNQINAMLYKPLSVIYP